MGLCTVLLNWVVFVVVHGWAMRVVYMTVSFEVDNKPWSRVFFQ